MRTTKCTQCDGNGFVLIGMSPYQRSEPCPHCLQTGSEPISGWVVSVGLGVGSDLGNCFLLELDNKRTVRVYKNAAITLDGDPITYAQFDELVGNHKKLECDLYLDTKKTNPTDIVKLHCFGE